MTQSITILGAHGSKADNAATTCIQVTPQTLIDAGNIMHALGENALHVNRIFFSHSHLDHIIDSAFLIDNSFANRSEPLYLYGLPETITALKTHIFNGDIWPDFSRIKLLKKDSPSLVYVELDYTKRYEVENNIFITPIPSNHTVACCGYLIEHADGSILFSADTFKNKALWDLINANNAIKALIIDVSFPNHFEKIAQESKHLTAAFLKEELEHLTRHDFEIYINHLKPFYHDKIVAELQAIGISEDKILIDGEHISFRTGALKRSSTRQIAQQKIQKLNKIGVALSAEENLETLLEMIVTEAKHLSHADGGTLYLLEDNNLHFKVVQTDSLGIKMGGSGSAITWPPLPLYLPDGRSNKKLVAATTVLENRLINLPDVYEAEGFSFEGTKTFDERTGYRSQSMLVIPLKDHEHKIIGVLQLLNKQSRHSQKVIPFDEEDEQITLSLASQAAIAITNTSLIQGLENLLEAFLKSIIFAISKKSPYTAGHIQRMVRLSVMLAEAIHHDTTVYKEKHFSQEALKQINFAALMHDIGKLATPEYIIDKATKLETIFDRIGLIECRAEIITKALRIANLEGKLSDTGYQENTALLNDHLCVLQKNNIGAEYMSDETQAYIKKITSTPWIIDGVNYPFVTDNEAYNLSVQRGTITNEEREIINHHAKLSVDILNKLPFPQKYKDIPQISGNHHEKINGKGYPLGLKGDEISFEARILAIADIFEALTASDRPYKKANPLSFAMKILHSMAENDELDRKMVKFFYDSGLYLQYAQKLLPKQSIDEVNVDFSSL